MAKKTEPIITHKEILNRAIRSFENEIKDLEAKRNGRPEVEEIIDSMIAPLKAKTETLYELYRFETGTDY